MTSALVFWAKRNRRLLVRASAISALLCAWAAMGVLVTKIEPLFVLVALAVPFGVLAVAKRIELGIPALSRNLRRGNLAISLRRCGFLGVGLVNLGFRQVSAREARDGARGLLL